MGQGASGLSPRVGFHRDDDASSYEMQNQPEAGDDVHSLKWFGNPRRALVRTFISAVGVGYMHESEDIPSDYRTACYSAPTPFLFVRHRNSAFVITAVV